MVVILTPIILMVVGIPGDLDFVYLEPLVASLLFTRFYRSQVVAGQDFSHQLDFVYLEPFDDPCFGWNFGLVFW